jgi:hypothetical protein
VSDRIFLSGNVDVKDVGYLPFGKVIQTDSNSSGLSVVYVGNPGKYFIHRPCQWAFALCDMCKIL